MKKQLLWIGAILLSWFLVNLVPGYFGWAVREGLGGIVIQMFFGYCALILVAQAFSVLAVLREIAREAGKRKKAAARELVR